MPSNPPPPSFRELVNLETTQNYLRKRLFVADTDEFAKRLCYLLTHLETEAKSMVFSP